MSLLQNLPIGNSSFERIRTKNDLYVDKTRHIFQLVDTGQYYFMSRPRRFGKSLTVSTLKCLFEGKKDLFDGLWISNHGDREWKEHPVVLVDFNELDHETPENLRQSLATHLDNTARQYGVRLTNSLLPMQFVELIVGLHEQTETPVTVLVDEYDKPIISHLGKGPEALEIAKKNREIMKYFFGVLKGVHVAPCLGFVFFTGVSKFSRVSIFSELNNLEDVTMVEDYADMMGYTQEEVERYFAPYIDDLAQQLDLSERDAIRELAAHYNGYRFSRKDLRVYNPFSLMSALKQKVFKNYWFETGTSTFLVNLLRESQFPLPMIENLQTDETSFSTYELEDLNPDALLFQTGYVTIKNVEDHIYCFDYPNREVKKAFLKHLLASYVKTKGAYSQMLRLAAFLRDERLDDFFDAMSAIFASIPHTLETRRDEAYFHTIFYLMVSASGADARSEVLHYRGRIDLAVEFSDKVYVIEFKCNQSAKAALKQICDKRYADMFRQSGKKIILMGVNFDSEKRNVAEWEVEELA
jgi:hypothetical protein